MAERGLLIALSGQQNAGKSTIFNRLTGAHQHVANYPGVTVDKKTGTYTHEARVHTVVDLPGTYSLTSFSLEERVARDFLVTEHPDAVVDVLDATSLKRGLGLVFQLIEMNLPVILAVNMLDVAETLGLRLDTDALGRLLGVPAVRTVGRTGIGADDLKEQVQRIGERRLGRSSFRVDYDALEPLVAMTEARFSTLPEAARRIPPRWLAVMLLQGDPEAEKYLRRTDPQATAFIARLRRAAAGFEAEHGLTPPDYISACRERAASEIVAAVVDDSRRKKVTITDRIDRVVLHRALAPVFLVLTVWLIYELAIEQGFRLADLLWPVLADGRGVIAGWLPEPGFLHDSPLRSLVLWIADSVSTLLGYVPIFVILFALVAILEDSGYMARIAFMLDRVLHKFGLHGQSTLPFVLSGVFAGGCAVPGVIATKAIPDPRARMATILTVPFMNCLAKIPLYTLLLNIFFAEHKALMLLYVSTIAIILALLVAKVLTLTLLQEMETAPFVMEMPHYHLPTVRNVATRAFERTWSYVRKVATIVLAITIIAFVLLRYPGMPEDRLAHYEARAEAAIADFQNAVADIPHRAELGGATLVRLVNLYDEYRRDRRDIAESGADPEALAALDRLYADRSPDLFRFAVSDESGRAAVPRALDVLATERIRIRDDMSYESMVGSALGRVGKAMESVTGAAGLDWRINVALITAIAARENSVATLGVLYRQGADVDRPLEERMAEAAAESGLTGLSAVSIILLFILFPPCLATMISIRMETRSARWTAFAMVYPVFIGLGVAVLVHTLGSLAGVDGVAAMSAFYAACLLMLLLVAFVRRPHARRAVLAGE